MNAYKFFTFIVVSVLVAILLASALNSLTRVTDSALADSARTGDPAGRPNDNVPRTSAGKNYLPIIFLNSATAGGAWLLAGNGGTNPASDFLGTTDKVTLTIRVSNTIAYRIAPAYDPFTPGFAPNIIGGSSANTIAPGVFGATIAGGGVSSFPNVITDTGSYAFIGGGYRNTASGGAATISGGALNTASINYATISGGALNTASGYAATVGGGYFNTASNSEATIAGGYLNSASGSGAFVGGGGTDGTNVGGNQAQGNASTIGGGLSNVITGTADYGFIGGGTSNTLGGLGASVIGGGQANTANGGSTFIGGGYGNNANANYAIIGGGYGNTIAITGTYAIIGGGNGNTASNQSATIGGGNGNIASNSYATVGGGQSNLASGGTATIGGGYFNTASNNNATIGGGGFNTAMQQYATVGGGLQNTASGAGAFIGGGGFDGSTTSGNQAQRKASTIGGGLDNVITGTADYGFIGGGESNTLSGLGSSVIGGGVSNTANGGSTFIGGGDSNRASSGYATIGGGFDNTASGYAATIGGGFDNTASGFYASVPGGIDNVASGSYSFAAGRHANTNNQDGAFVWADSTAAGLNATTANQFLVRATGGISFATNTALTTGCSIPAGGGSWNCTSDKNVKANFANVDSRAILAQVNALPITTWNYTTQDESIRHIGPMAQDFAAAFKVGENDTTISTVDAQGVALAAIQGLAQENQDLKAQNASLDARLTALEQQSSSLISLNTLVVGALIFGAFLVGRRGNKH